MPRLNGQSSTRALRQYAIGRQAFVVTRIGYHNLQSALFHHFASLSDAHTLDIRHSDTFAMVGVPVKSVVHTYNQQDDHECHRYQVPKQELTTELAEEFFCFHLNFTY